MIDGPRWMHRDMFVVTDESSLEGVYKFRRFSNFSVVPLLPPRTRNLAFRSTTPTEYLVARVASGRKRGYIFVRKSLILIDRNGGDQISILYDPRNVQYLLNYNIYT